MDIRPCFFQRFFKRNDRSQRIAMNKDLNNLLLLQEYDCAIIDLEISKEEFPIKVGDLEKAIRDAADAIEGAKAQKDKLLQEKKSVEDQIAQAAQALEKSQDRLNSIKTNKEYDAVHAEIETNKAIVAGADKRLKKFTGDIEALDTLINEKSDAFTKISSENQPQIDDLKAKIATIDSSVAEVVTKREAVAANVGKHIIRAYDHIRSNRKKGKVISLVSGRERNCTVCYQAVPPQLINLVRKETELVYCQGCGSILIWEGSVSAEPQAPASA
jgi:hypothetical protein